MFINYLSPGRYAEYFFLFVPPIILIFTENKFLITIGFVASYLGFILPNKIFNFYPNQYLQDDYFSLVLFTVVFFLVYYFKSNNSKNEKLLELKALELEEVNQFQSQFFINISHEIKTPLTLIKGQVDNFYDTKDLDTVKHKINQQISNIQKIVDDVIDLSKMGDDNFTLHKEVIDLKKLMLKLQTSFDSLFDQKKITFNCLLTTDDCYILADALYLERAINNLILNAYKYTNKKGEVIVKLIKKDNKIKLSVSDTGIGIDKSNLHKIFNRFYQVNNDFNKTGGSGVGLAFTKEIVNLLEGDVKVTSQPEKGSVFTLIFPCVKGENKVLIPKKEIDQKPLILEESNAQTDKNISVLIVDDSFEMRNYLKELLIGYNCFEAENGEEAIKKLKKKKIDFLLTDYMMPKMDGFELITYMNKNNIIIPTLMLTARSDYNSKLQVLKLGIADYLSKPFDKDELLVRIQNILKNHHNRNLFVQQEEVTTLEIQENQKWVLKLKKYIVKNCDDPKLNQIEIAEHFNISKSTFYRKVKMETGLTPNEFINEIKLLEARKIVEQNSNLSLKELSLKVGFLHTSYFANQYKKRFGTHPIKQQVS
ncbi:response regulator [Wenyingzhuangia fucanilytica]|nr:response regulator [Wenyingzhuangia fucanilytica]